MHNQRKSNTQHIMDKSRQKAELPKYLYLARVKFILDIWQESLPYISLVTGVVEKEHLLSTETQSTDMQSTETQSRETCDRE